MKTILQNWIKTPKPKQNKIAQKQEEIRGHMNNVHALQSFNVSSKLTCDSSMFSRMSAEYSKGLA